MLAILCNNCCLFHSTFLTPIKLGVTFYSVSCEFPRPDKIDRFTFVMETERPND